MRFSATTHHDRDGVVRLCLAGDVHRTAAPQLALMIFEIIVVYRPDILLIDLDAVAYLDRAGIRTLTAGYVAAIDYGTTYRVINPNGRVRQAMQSRGVLDMLADSDDIAALVLTVLTQSPTPPHRP